MLNYPIEFPSPTEDAISQLREKGSIERGQVSVALERVGEKTIGMGMGPLQPIQEIEADRPRSFPFCQNLPVLAISSSLAIRSSIGGCVLKRERTPPPFNGLTINM